MDIGELALDIARHIEGIIVGIARHTDDEVDDGGAQHLGSLFGGRDLGKGWWITESQLHILIIYLLLDTSIILKHERIVRVGYNQHIVDTSHHQIDK